MTDLTTQIADLDCWQGPVTPLPLAGGITNANFIVKDQNKKYVVRAGADIPLHHVMRFNELAASRAGFSAGLSPEVIHSETGFMVLQFIDGKTLTENDVQQQSTLARLLPVLKQCHYELPEYLTAPALSFWVFHILRDYCKTITNDQGRLSSILPDLMKNAETLEKAVGSIDVVFGHNDLLASNFIDDGKKVWLIDWDYAGFNSPLFDLGGLASNNGLSEAQEKWLLENYFSTRLHDKLWSQYCAMKCASLLRETLWSMVSEIHSTLDLNYQSYTDENLTKYQTSFADFQNL